MRLLVSGGTGFIGVYLVPRLVEAGHEPVLLARRAALGRVAGLPGVRVIEADPMRPGPWWNAIDDCEAAINLCGEPIHGRWTETKKSRIRESRLRPLAHLIAAIPQDRPFKLLSASAVGYYGDAGEQVLNETAPPGRDFLARMARDWETQALTAEGGCTRVALLRFGMVLGVGGGALEELIKALQRRVGAIIGRGRQWVSWIHQEDVARAMLFLLENDRLDGPFNLASPEPRRQGDIVRSLASQIGCRVGLPTPARAVRVATGGFADALLASQRMSPDGLLAAGFEFRYSNIDEAFAEILARRGRPAV